MNRSLGMLLVLAAGSATAVSQDVGGPLPYGGSINPPVRVERSQWEHTPPPYGSRARLTVYDNFTNVYITDRDDGHLGSCARIVDDIDFAPGPYADATTRTLMQMSYGWSAVSDANLTISMDLVIEFYDIDDLDYSGFGVDGQNMIRAGATPLAVLSVAYQDVPTGYYYDSTITLPNIAVGDSRVAIQAWYRDPNTGQQIADANYGPGFHIGSNTHATEPASPASPGWTLPDYGRDVGSNPTEPTNNDGVCSGNSVAEFAGVVERRILNPAALSPPRYRSWDVRLKGDVAVTYPSCTSVGINESLAGSAPANGVAWYCVTLADDATDGAEQFLDIDTDGSADDTIIAIYNSESELLAQDDDDGQGAASQLTFGIGRREKTDDTGKQYDGRDGELLAGTYYIAVGGKPTTFGDAFFINSTSAATNFNLRVRSNTNGSPAGAAVAPDVLNDMGVLLDPGGSNASYEPQFYEVAFYKFELCSDACGERYLDIDLSQSDPEADTVIFLFDDFGQLLATNDDGTPGVYFQSQLSFGNSDTPRLAYGVGAPDFAGQDGDLPSGVYYFGIGNYAVSTAPNADRWHLRSDSTSGLPWLPQFYTNMVECGLVCCPACAADFNQDGGVDGADVEAFYLVWEGGEPCGDVNEDGGVDGGDVETFFVIWENGGC